MNTTRTSSLMGSIVSRIAFVLVAWLAFMLAGASAQAQTACSGAGCVSAGPRLASISSSQSALLNGLMGGLLGSGSALNVSVADWNAIATGSISLPKLLGSIQSTQGLASPTQALTTQQNVGTLVSAMAGAASSQGNTTLAAALNNAAAPLSVSSGTIALGELVKTDAGLGNTSLNALELLTGSVQTLNSKNAVATPQAITLSGSALGLSGVGNVSLQAQVIEPPVYVCGTVGSTFHTASVRIKLNLALLNLAVDTSGLTSLLGISTASLTLTNLDLYIELAKATGVITQLNAATNAMTVQATPGVANLYLGSIADTVFFDRSRGVATTIPLSNIGYGPIGNLSINGSGLVNVGVRSMALGSAPSATTMNFTGTTPTQQTAQTGVNFAGNLLSTLVGNLQLQLTPSLPLVTGLVQLTLIGIVQSALQNILSPVLTSVVQPLLDLMGMGLGIVEVNAAGAFYLCTVSGLVYSDANHNARNDIGEAGMATAMFAKLVATNAATGPPTVYATVDQTTGIYTFTNVSLASYNIVVNTGANTTNVTPAAPSGWVPTETPTMSRAISVSGTVLTAQNFGFWRGNSLTGVVFKDTGVGTGGVANNVVKDGTEAGLPGTTVKVTDSSAATTYDTATTDGAGAYTLWIPYTAGATALKVTQVMDGSLVSVGANVGNTAGTYAQATSTVAFTNSTTTVYTGVNFAAVPANKFVTDGQQTALPGSSLFYAHTYTAGTAGLLSLSPSAGPATGWSATTYVDTNCNGKIDAGEAVMGAAQALIADQKYCVVVKVFVPENAPISSRYAMALTAHYVYANNTLTNDLLRTDLTVVGNATEAGLLLTKAVDKTTAAVGDTLVYTITYLNQSDAALASLKVYDTTPAYTVFSAAACGTAPAGLVCSVQVKPAANASGAVQWNFTGTLPAGATGTVTMTVIVQ